MCNQCQVYKDQLLISQGFLRQFLWTSNQARPFNPNKDLMNCINRNTDLLQLHMSMTKHTPAIPLAHYAKTALRAS